MSWATLQGDALVAAQLEVALREPVEQLVVERVDHRYVGEIESQFDRALVDEVAVAEQCEIAHLASPDAVGGAQHPIVGALGQHDVRSGGPRPFDQFVLEHHRRHHLGAPDLDATLQRLQIDVGLDLSEGDVDLALVTGGDRAFDRIRGDRGVEGVGVHRQQRDRGATRHRIDQRDHPRVGLQAAAHDHAGHTGIGRRRARHRCGDDHISSIAGGDEHGVVVHVVEHVRHRHRSNLDLPHGSGEVVGVTGDQFGAERDAELVERRLAQCWFLGDRPHAVTVVEVEVSQRVGERAQRGGFDPVDDDRRDGVFSERIAPDHDPLDDLGGAAEMPVDHRDDRQSEVLRDSGVDLQFDR